MPLDFDHLDPKIHRDMEVVKALTMVISTLTRKPEKEFNLKDLSTDSGVHQSRLDEEFLLTLTKLSVARVAKAHGVVYVSYNQDLLYCSVLGEKSSQPIEGT